MQVLTNPKFADLQITQIHEVVLWKFAQGA
jgi:hypothetical protein